MLREIGQNYTGYAANNAVEGWWRNENGEMAVSIDLIEPGCWYAGDGLRKSVLSMIRKMNPSDLMRDGQMVSELRYIEWQEYFVHGEWDEDDYNTSRYDEFWEVSYEDGIVVITTEDGTQVKIREKQNVCLHCGQRVRLHGGVKWAGGPAGADAEGYTREFDGTFLYETYTCPKCGGEWTVNRETHDEYDANPSNYRRLASDGCPDCGSTDCTWEDETITSKGNKIRVNKVCEECGSWYLGVFPLGAPTVEKRDN